MYSAHQGKFQGLDLNEELHVGGYPNYTSIVKTAGIKTGFVGKILFTVFDYHRMEKAFALVNFIIFLMILTQAVFVSWSSKERK